MAQDRGEGMSGGRFLRMPEVAAQVGLSSRQINRLHGAGEFPQKIRISTNSIGWWEADITRWKEERACVPRNH